MSPFARNNGETSWHEEVWLDILNYHYGKTSYDEINEKYGNAYAISEVDISTPTIMNRLGRLNKGKSYEHQIKPFNFCLVGVGCWTDSDASQVVKPLAPYRKDMLNIAHIVTLSIIILGSIWAKNNLGTTGATFVFTLPLDLRSVKNETAETIKQGIGRLSSVAREESRPVN